MNIKRFVAAALITGLSVANLGTPAKAQQVQISAQCGQALDQLEAWHRYANVLSENSELPRARYELSRIAPDYGRILDGVLAYCPQQVKMQIASLEKARVPALKAKGELNLCRKTKGSALMMECIIAEIQAGGQR